MTSPFSDLARYAALSRVDGLTVSPDGTRVALTVTDLTADGTAYRSSIWTVPGEGGGTPVRRTRSEAGEVGAGFTRSGDLLVVSARPSGDDRGAGAPQLWLLPADGGDARPLTRFAGGVQGVLGTAAHADTVAVVAGIMPGVQAVPGDVVDADAEIRGRRTDREVRAILHETYPVRFWDHDLGPDEPHVLTLDAGSVRATSPDRVPSDVPVPVDLTPAPARSLERVDGAVAPDGSVVVTTVRVQEARGSRATLVAVDVASGARTVLVDETGHEHELPRISHDGRTLAWVRAAQFAPEAAPEQEVWVAELDGTTLSGARRIATDWDRWPDELVFAHTDDALLAIADQDGRAPVFRLPLDGGAVEQLTHDDWAYSSLHVAEETGAVVALRSSWQAPLHPVRIADDGTVTPLAMPAALPDIPGRVEEVETTAADGARLRAWLVLPSAEAGDGPHPLLLWAHGGPVGSWNRWSWRWNPHLAAARGYAVLLPDPAVSTGYGLDFLNRGWNAWGQAPYTDLMAITDLVVARPDIDETRTAAMGGSFGGYMANWIAGHTDRFRAIVSHAGFWAMDQFSGTTDMSQFWHAILGDDARHENDPRRFVADITTPMLVIHGDRDYRVPIGEALRLWSELAEHHAAADGTMPHRFLYFPDENHWILKPQHAVLWNETVFAFLAQHVLGEEWERPELLG